MKKRLLLSFLSLSILNPQAVTIPANLNASPELMADLENIKKFQMPKNHLEFVYSQKFAERWKVSFKAQNLLDDDVEFLQGDAITRQYSKGRSFGVGVSYDFL